MVVVVEIRDRMRFRTRFGASVTGMLTVTLKVAVVVRDWSPWTRVRVMVRVMRRGWLP